MSFEYLKSKNEREWKHGPDKEKMDYSWFLKEKYQGNADNIHLYYAKFAYLKNDYHSLGLLWDICLMTANEFGYALVKHDKNYVNIQYCLKVSNYKIDEIFTKFWAGVVHDIECKSVSFYIFVCFLIFYNLQDMIM